MTGNRVHPEEPIELTTGSEARAATVLTDAFMEDPVSLSVFTSRKRRYRPLMWLHQKVIKYCLLYGVIHTLPAVEGVACWLPPGNAGFPAARIIRSGLWALPLRFGAADYRRFNSLLSIAEEIRRRIAPDPDWYLWLLGIETGLQGQGVGGRLISPILHRADRENQYCYLETEKEENIRFYERHGFRVAESQDIPYLGIRTSAMVRKPGSAPLDNP